MVNLEAETSIALVTPIELPEKEPLGGVDVFIAQLYEERTTPLSIETPEGIKTYNPGTDQTIAQLAALRDWLQPVVGGPKSGRVDLAAFLAEIVARDMLNYILSVRVGNGELKVVLAPPQLDISKNGGGLPERAGDLLVLRETPKNGHKTKVYEPILMVDVSLSRVSKSRKKPGTRWEIASPVGLLCFGDLRFPVGNSRYRPGPFIAKVVRPVIASGEYESFPGVNLRDRDFLMREMEEGVAASLRQLEQNIKAGNFGNGSMGKLTGKILEKSRFIQRIFSPHFSH